MSPRKIIVIDDEPDVCFLLRGILEETGKYCVLEAYEGQEGLRLSLEENPALIFLDYVMPGMTGDQVITCLRKNARTKKTPIVLMSGMGEAVYFDKIGLYAWLTEDMRSGADSPDKWDIKWDELPGYVAGKMNADDYLVKPFTSERVLEAAARLVKEP